MTFSRTELVSSYSLLHNDLSYSPVMTTALITQPPPHDCRRTLNLLQLLPVQESCTQLSFCARVPLDHRMIDCELVVDSSRESRLWATDFFSPWYGTLLQVFKNLREGRLRRAEQQSHERYRAFVQCIFLLAY